MENIEITEYTKNDRESCLILLEKSFQGISDERNFIWRFETPNRPPPVIVCAKHNDDIVGFDSYIPWRFTYDNKQYIGYQGGESATDKAYRGQGIQNRIKKFACELALVKGIDFIFGSGNLPNIKAAIKSGFHPVGSFPLYQRLVSPFLKKYSDAREVGSKIPFNIMLKEEKKITPIVDDNYLEWRYFMNPKDYDILELEKDNNQAMFCVRKRKRRDNQFRITTADLLVLDCQFSSLNNKFIKWAFNCLERIYSRSVMTMSIFFNENTERGRAISKHFCHRRSSHDYGFLVRPIKKDLDLNIFLNHNNWDVLPHIVDWW